MSISYQQFLKEAGGTSKDVQVANSVQTSQPTRESAGQSLLSSTGNSIADMAKGGVSNIGSGLQDLFTPPDVNYKNVQDTTKQLGVGAGIAEAGAQVLKSAANKVGDVGKIVGGIGQVVTSPISGPAFGVGSQIGDAIGKGVPPDAAKKFFDFLDKNPQIGQDTNLIMNLANLAIPEAARKGGLPRPGGTGETPIAPKAPVPPSAARSTMSSTLKSAGEGMYGLSVPMQESTKIALQNYQAGEGGLMDRVKGKLTGDTKNTPPITEAQTAARHGLTGTEWQLGVQAKQVAGKLWQQDIEPVLAKSKARVSMSQFFDEVEKEINSSTKELGNRNALLEGLNALKEDYKSVRNISLTKLQQYKEGWAKFLPDSTYKGKPIANSLKAVKDIAAAKAREIIYKHGGPEIQQAYIDYGNLKSIEEAGRKSVDLLRSKGISKQVWEFVLDKLVTPVATIGGKVLYRTGEGLEFVGDRGAKQVRDVIGEPPAQAAPPQLQPPTVLPSS